MNLWKLSLCYLGRKKGKTITLFIVFFTIGMCLISLSGISRSLEKKIISSQERAVYLTASNGAAWPGKAKEALQAADITKKLEACRLTGVKTGLRLLSLSQSTAEEPGTLTVAGYGQTASLSAFQSRRLLLIRGRHLTAEDRDQALMHAALAEKNQLDIGKTIRVGEKEVTIAGLFTQARPDGNQLLHTNLANTLIAHESLVADLSGQSGYQSLYLTLSKPELVEPVIGSIRQWPLDWEKLSVQNAREYYGDAYQNVITLQTLVSKILAQFSILAILVLVLMLSFWINSRVRETGILLAIGMSKQQVVIHYLIEVLLVALAAFAFSIPAGGLIGQRLSDALMSQVNGGIAASVLHQGGLDAGRIDAVSVSIGWQDVLRLYLQGSLTCAASVALSSLSIARLHPKQILTKMS